MVEMTGAIIVAEEATIEIAAVLENTKLITNDKNKGKMKILRTVKLQKILLTLVMLLKKLKRRQNI